MRNARRATTRAHLRVVGRLSMHPSGEETAGLVDGECDNIATRVGLLAEWGPGPHGLDRGVRSSALTMESFAPTGGQRLMLASVTGPTVTVVAPVFHESSCHF